MTLSTDARARLEDAAHGNRYEVSVRQADLRALLASTPAPVEVEEWAWRRIESAPLDGTHVLLRFGEDGVSVGWYDDNGFDPRPWRFVDTGFGDNPTAKGFINASRDGVYGPSHWQPLPATGPITATLRLVEPSPAITVEGIAEMIRSELDRQAKLYTAFIANPDSRFEDNGEQQLEGLSYDGFIELSSLAQAIHARIAQQGPSHDLS